MMSISSSTKQKAANAAGVVTALAFLSQEAEAAFLVYAPAVPADFEFNIEIGFEPNSLTTSMTFCFGTSIGMFTFDSDSLEIVTSTTNGLDIVLQNSTTALTSNTLVSSADIGETSLTLTTTPDTNYFFAYGWRNDGSSDPYNLGWVEITNVDDNNALIEWGYESVAGDSVTTGVVPEPASAALIFGSVAFGFFLVARRNKSNRYSPAE